MESSVGNQDNVHIVRVKSRLTVNSTQLFLVALILILFSFMVDSFSWSHNMISFMRMLRDICRALSIGFLLLNIALKIKHRSSHYLMAATIILLLFLSYLNTGATLLLFTAIFTLTAIDVPYKKIVKTFFVMNIVWLMALIALHSLSLTNDVIRQFPYGIGRSLGMVHPNRLGSFLFAFLVSLWLVSKGRRRVVISLLAPLLALVTWNITVSRTALLMMIVFSIATFLLYLLEKIRSERLLKGIRFAIIFLFITTVTLTIIPNDLVHRLDIIDVTFFSRFSHPALIFQEFGVGLFGGDIPLMGTVEAFELRQRGYQVRILIVDNAFLRLLVVDGIVALLIALVAIFKITKRFILARRYDLLIIFALLATYGMMGLGFLAIHFNILWLVLYCSLGTEVQAHQVVPEGKERKYESRVMHPL